MCTLTAHALSLTFKNVARVSMATTIDATTTSQTVLSTRLNNSCVDVVKCIKKQLICCRMQNVVHMITRKKWVLGVGCDDCHKLQLD